MSNFTNSPLVNYVKMSPNFTDKRNHIIDIITIHCVAGNCSIEALGELFANPDRNASSNYGIGSDGRIGLFVDEEDRSWCTSSKQNDHRAVTIEVANITGAPEWNVSDAAYRSLILLCVDICKRNGKNKMLWFNDKAKTLSYNPAANEMLMTAHRWFAAKACPGNWLYNNMGKIANDVNVILNGTVKEEVPNNTNELSNEEKLYNFLKSKGLNNFAIFGLMANIFAESGFRSNNLQNSYEKKFGLNDDQYTAKVDDGSYDNFVRDKAGYGLAQWTFWSRKQALYDFIKSKGASIGDFDLQCQYLWNELQGYKSVMNVLNNATSLRQASDVVLLEYEKPADKSEAVQLKRFGYAEDLYNKYVDEVENKLPYTVRILVDDLNIRKGPGTNYDKTGKSIDDRGVYTIVEEAAGEKGAKLWGKLKSGAGWIALTSYTQRLS